MKPTNSWKKTRCLYGLGCSRSFAQKRKLNSRGCDSRETPCRREQSRRCAEVNYWHFVLISSGCVESSLCAPRANKKADSQVCVVVGGGRRRKQQKRYNYLWRRDIPAEKKALHGKGAQIAQTKKAASKKDAFGPKSIGHAHFFSSRRTLCLLTLPYKCTAPRTWIIARIANTVRATSASPVAYWERKDFLFIFGRASRRGENSLCVIFEMRGGNLYLPSGRSSVRSLLRQCESEKKINYKLWITPRGLQLLLLLRRPTDLPSSNSCGGSLINWWTCAGRHAQIKSPYANFEWGLQKPQWRAEGGKP
jgi:hypothetical protein